jgi:DNA-binding NtrC family response regulator
MSHKILIADDEEIIRRAIQRIFDDCVVVCAGDGAAALDLIAAERPAVVLLDLVMPLMGGLEVLGALKGAEYAPPVIILTGNGEIEMATAALRAGALSYLTKPFSTEVIRGLVLAALEEGGGKKRDKDRPWRVKGEHD